MASYFSIQEVGWPFKIKSLNLAWSMIINSQWFCRALWLTVSCFWTFLHYVYGVVIDRARTNTSITLPIAFIRKSRKKEYTTIKYVITIIHKCDIFQDTASITEQFFLPARQVVSGGPCFILETPLSYGLVDIQYTVKVTLSNPLSNVGNYDHDF